MKDVVEINDIDIGRNGKFDEVMLPNKTFLKSDGNIDMVVLNNGVFVHKDSDRTVISFLDDRFVNVLSIDDANVKILKADDSRVIINKADVMFIPSDNSTYVCLNDLFNAIAALSEILEQSLAAGIESDDDNTKKISMALKEQYEKLIGKN